MNPPLDFEQHLGTQLRHLGDLVDDREMSDGIDAGALVRMRTRRRRTRVTATVTAAAVLSGAVAVAVVTENSGSRVQPSIDTESGVLPRLVIDDLPEGFAPARGYEPVVVGEFERALRIDIRSYRAPGADAASVPAVAVLRRPVAWGRADSPVELVYDEELDQFQAHWVRAQHEIDLYADGVNQEDAESFAVGLDVVGGNLTVAAPPRGLVEVIGIDDDSLPPHESYSVTYANDAGEELTLSIERGSAALSEAMWFMDKGRGVSIGSRSGVLRAGDDDVWVQWSLSDSLIAQIQAVKLDESDVLAAAASLRSVDEAEWRAMFGLEAPGVAIPAGRDEMSRLPRFLVEGWELRAAEVRADDGMDFADGNGSRLWIYGAVGDLHAPTVWVIEGSVPPGTSDTVAPTSSPATEVGTYGAVTTLNWRNSTGWGNIIGFGVDREQFEDAAQAWRAEAAFRATAQDEFAGLALNRELGPDRAPGAGMDASFVRGRQLIELAVAFPVDWTRFTERLGGGDLVAGDWRTEDDTPVLVVRENNRFHAMWLQGEALVVAVIEGIALDGLADVLGSIQLVGPAQFDAASAELD